MRYNKKKGCIKSSLLSVTIIVKQGYLGKRAMQVKMVKKKITFIYRPLIY